MTDHLEIRKIECHEYSVSQWAQPFLHFPVEPHQQLLKQPEPHQKLYKIIKKKHFDDMVKNNYIYFTRIDTYNDDKADGEQLPLDRSQNKNQSFSNYPSFTLENYYNQSRSRSYAYCMSLEFLEDMKIKYGGDHPVCLEFSVNELRNTLNETIECSNLICDGQQLPQMFSINYGIVEYAQRDSFKSPYINPIKYTYLKDESYKNEKEFRISLSTLGIPHFATTSEKMLDFKNSLKFHFDWSSFLQKGWVKIIK